MAMSTEQPQTLLTRQPVQQQLVPSLSEPPAPLPSSSEEPPTLLPIFASLTQPFVFISQLFKLQLAPMLLP